MFRKSLNIAGKNLLFSSILSTNDCCLVKSRSLSPRFLKSKTVPQNMVASSPVHLNQKMTASSQLQKKRMASRAAEDGLARPHSIACARGSSHAPRGWPSSTPARPASATASARSGGVPAPGRAPGQHLLPRDAGPAAGNSAAAAPNDACLCPPETRRAPLRGSRAGRAAPLAAGRAPPPPVTRRRLPPLTATTYEAGPGPAQPGSPRS